MRVIGSIKDCYIKQFQQNHQIEVPEVPIEMYEEYEKMEWVREVESST